MIAVAYFGKGATKLLPLDRGSTLIVDMSRPAVGSGQTLPKEILKLVNRGVEVHSVQNLHAKVFVIANRAFIGSTNVSNHSANGLIEACVETDNRTVVRSCRDFVASLCGEIITPRHATRMQRFYKPPKFGSPAVLRPNGKRVTPRHSPLWIVPLVREGWEEADYEQEKQGMAKAKKNLRSTRRFFVEDFRWTADRFLERAQKGDLVIQALNEGKRRIMVSPPARLIDIRAYTKGRSNRAIVYLESAKGVRRTGLRALAQRVGPQVKKLCRGNSAKALRDWALVHALLSVWPSGNG
jgi:hypothetical protein